jgi:hypothetical protein
MLLAHARTLAEARSCLATLSARAGTADASAGYEQLLLRLDALHGGDVPPLTLLIRSDLGDRDDDCAARGDCGEHRVLCAAAASAIADLTGHGVDALQVELLLVRLERVRLEEARDRDVR